MSKEQYQQQQQWGSRGGFVGRARGRGGGKLALPWYWKARGLLEWEQVSCSSYFWHIVLQAPVKTGTRDTATTGIRGMGTMATTAKGMEVMEDMTTLVTTTTMDMVTIAVSTELLKSPDLLFVGKLLLQIKKIDGFWIYWFRLSADLAALILCMASLVSNTSLSQLFLLHCVKCAWTLVM